LNFILSFVYPGMKVDSNSNLCTSGVKVTLLTLGGPFQARKGGEEVGESFRRDLKLISEVQAPFRGVRKFFYVSFAAAAGISTLFTLPRLVSAIQGGEGAPGLLETSQNLAINISGEFWTGQPFTILWKRDQWIS
jgi:hypothetical protein